jgi:ADP-heptose:LPS heptosyltransferase
MLSFLFPNPLDSQLKRVKGKRVLVCWNRGLGDIALGLFALTMRIRSFIPQAEITFLTRSDLVEGFSLLKEVHVMLASDWKRGSPFDLDGTLAAHGKRRDDFDLVLEQPNVTKWLKWQLGVVTPKLSWKSEWDGLHDRFNLKGKPPLVAVQVQTETNYHYEKNWPIDSWRELFQKLRTKFGFDVVLFGLGKSSTFEQEGVIDLRGETSLLEMLSIIKNRCRFLIVPDSGVLSLTYYLDTPFPLDVVSLWADPRQGVLKQNVASPNSELSHFALIGQDGKMGNIDVETVLERVAVMERRRNG